MTALFVTLHLAFSIVWWIVILSAIFSWLYAFNVVNPRNQFVNAIGSALYRLTEPIYRPIRRLLPDLGGIDISPIVVLLLLTFLEIFMHTSIEPLLGVVH
ncbi:MAG: YggT family protein [Rhizobiaceae bacterium]